MLNRSFVKIQHAKNQIQIKEYLKTEDNYYISHECFCDILIIYSMKNDINIFITADIIWFSNSTVRKVKKFILRFLSIKDKNIVLAASHTHGTPNPEESISFPIFSRKFDNHILNCIKKTFKEAYKKRKISTLVNFVRLPVNDFSINRRRKSFVFGKNIKYQMQNLPNFKKKIDENIDLIDFQNRLNKKIVVSIVRTTCHPVASPKGIKGADYVGYLKEKLNKRSDSVLFLQGFCGDIRPKVIKQEKSLKDLIIRLTVGKRFRPVNEKDAPIIAKNISQSIIKNSKKLNRINICQTKVIEILEEIKLSDNTYHFSNLNITLWDWGKIIFMFINAEVLSGYNLFEYKNKKVLCVGYANGMIGYLPTKKDILEGGYEIEKSRKFFNIRKNLNLDIEKTIKKRINYFFSRMYHF